MTYLRPNSKHKSKRSKMKELERIRKNLNWPYLKGICEKLLLILRSYKVSFYKVRSTQKSIKYYQIQSLLSIKIILVEKSNKTLIHKKFLFRLNSTLNKQRKKSQSKAFHTHICDSYLWQKVRSVLRILSGWKFKFLKAYLIENAISIVPSWGL